MVGIQKLADLMHLTPRHVQRLAKEGMPKSARGNYDEVACLSWYAGYLQDKLKAGGAAPGEAGPVLSGRERLANAKAGREELNLAIDLKQLVTVADWEKAISDIIVPARHELLAIRPRLRPVIGVEAADRVGAEIIRSLRSLGVTQELIP
jgi:phage terminase Nu1 subunit (DNA packaging protein)